MNDQQDDQLGAEAAAWHVASADDAMDWDGFTAWLETSPAHRRAYDEVALADALVAEHREVLATLPEPSNVVPFAPAATHRARWRPAVFGGAMAAAAALAVALLSPSFFAHDRIYRTNGESQTLALADGVTVTLAPHSQLTVDGSDPQQLALNGGGWFDVAHDPSRTLRVTAGNLEIRDIGTRFDVQAQTAAVRVAVAQGTVSVVSQALGAPIKLAEGRHLLFDPKGGTALVGDAPAAQFGAWRSGRLSYDEAPLALVLEDLSRYAEVRVSQAEGLQGRRFSGTLIVGNGERAVRDLAQLMGLAVERSADGYRLHSGSGARQTR